VLTSAHDDSVQMTRREGLSSLCFVWKYFKRQQEVTSPDTA